MPPLLYGPDKAPLRRSIGFKPVEYRSDPGEQDATGGQIHERGDGPGRWHGMEDGFHEPKC